MLSSALCSCHISQSKGPGTENWMVIRAARPVFGPFQVIDRFGTTAAAFRFVVGVPGRCGVWSLPMAPPSGTMHACSCECNEIRRNAHGQNAARSGGHEWHSPVRLVPVARHEFRRNDLRGRSRDLESRNASFSRLRIWIGMAS